MRAPRAKRIRALQELRLRRANQADKPSLPYVVPGFPRHSHSLGASRRKAGALPALSLDIFWLKDESLEDSANLASASPSRVPGFPRHSHSLGASCRKAGALPAPDPDIIAAE